jgi:MtrB/PioB family decaheme-associated outer membrane protein
MTATHQGKSTMRAVAAVVAAGVVLAVPVAARAQGTTATAAGEIGIRAFGERPPDSALAKFIQYRDMPSGLIFPSLYFGIARDSLSTLQLFGRNIGQKDQDLALRGNLPGTGDIQLRWDRITHVFSTNSRFLGTETSPGVYTLPVPRPDTATLNHSAYVAPVRTQWDPVNATITLMPSPLWDFKAEYQHVGKDGYRPMGMVFGGSNNNAREINEPIDQSMNDIRISQAFSQKRFQEVVTYAYSQFTNALQSVTSDNPLVTVDSLKLGTSRGRTALAPNNSAQTLTAVAAGSLPLHTRVTGTVSFGWRSQNQAFIAPTINTQNADSLTRAGYVFPTSLDGSIHTTLTNFTLTSRPVRLVTVSARYRSYDFKDLSQRDSIPILVISDRTFAAGALSEGYPYSRDNADASVSIRPLLPVNVTAGYNWDQMNRDSTVRNVMQVTEKTGRVSFDYAGSRWGSARVSYTYGERRGNAYNQLTTAENPDTRRFDEADRNHKALMVMLSATPVDQVSLTGTYQVGRDSFPNSAYGVQHDNSNSIGFDVDITPTPRVSISGGYLHEWYDNQMRSLYRTGSTSATLANPTWNWIATNIDSSTIGYASFTATLIPNRLEVSGMWQISKSVFQMKASNPVTPAGGTVAQDSAATAMTFPAATQELQPLSIQMRYKISSNWSVVARFETEHYANYDIRTTNLAPATGNFIFQGNSLLPYDAKYFTFLVAFRPGLIRVPRSAM